MDPVIPRLFHAHANAQRGFYFDNILESRPGLYVATSNLIADPFWNYAFSGTEETLGVWSPKLSEVFSEVDSSGARLPAMLLTEGTPLENDSTFLSMYSLFADDFWMIADTAAFSTVLPDGFTVSLVKTPADFAAATTVFADAYTTESEDGVGYEGLPEEYTEAFSRGLARADQFGSDHLIGRVRGEAVAIASVFYSGGAAGLYSVAVRRDARLRGFGSSISRLALERAQGKAEIAFLQTEPDSPVQKMYEHAGFRKLVHARLWSQAPSE